MTRGALLWNHPTEPLLPHFPAQALEGDRLSGYDVLKRPWKKISGQANRRTPVDWCHFK